LTPSAASASPSLGSPSIPIGALQRDAPQAPVLVKRFAKHCVIPVEHAVYQPKHPAVHAYSLFSSQPWRLSYTTRQLLWSDEKLYPQRVSASHFLQSHAQYHCRSHTMTCCCCSAEAIDATHGATRSAAKRAAISSRALRVARRTRRLRPSPSRSITG